MPANDTLIIDLAILMVRKYADYLVKSCLREDSSTDPLLSAVRGQAFVVRRRTVWEYRAALRQWSSTLENATWEDRKLFLLLLGMNLYAQNGVMIWHAACFMHRLPSRAIFAMQHFLSGENPLVRNGTIMIEDSDFQKSNLSLVDFANMHNQRRVFLSPLAVNIVFKSTTGQVLYDSGGFAASNRYKSVDALLTDIAGLMKYIFFLSQFYRLDGPSSNMVKDSMYEKGEFARNLRRFRRNILKSGLHIPLIDFLKMNTLTNIEFVVLMYLVYRVIITKEVIINNIEEFLSHLAFIPSQTRAFLSCFTRDSVFVRENLVQQSEMYPSFPFEEEDDDEEMDDEHHGENVERPSDSEYMGFASDFASISISKDKIYRLLFSDVKPGEPRLPGQKTEAERLEGMLDSSNPHEKDRGKGLFEIITPKVNLESVILDEEVKKDLLGAVDLTRAAETMKQWGVRPNLAAQSFGSIKILLYGLSGTGKTITAQALAGEAGADMYKVDASNLVSSWVGESTKNVKKVFREFYRHQKNSPKKLFLFMNEADQLLSARGAIMQAADKEYNQMQNILLEELENFDGVFIATTNLVDLFDTAWNRRFNVKIRFDIPKYETRQKLWKVHISDKMPVASDVDFNRLAEYELAGGSIANVVYNAARKAALREGERSVTMKDFLDAIQNEMKSHLGAKTSRVGFQQ